MLHLGVDLVAVTVMANLGLHRLAEEHGIRVVTTDVGYRYVVEALRREGGVLGGEQSGHIIYLRDHVTGDGLAAALLLCGALGGRTLEQAAAVMPHFPQVKENIRVGSKELPAAVRAEVERLNEQLDGRGRVLVRPSGTEPRAGSRSRFRTAPRPNLRQTRHRVTPAQLVTTQPRRRDHGGNRDRLGVAQSLSPLGT